MDGLKERDFFGLGDRFWVVSREGIDFGESSYGIQKAVFDLRVGDIVRRRFENVEFISGAGVEVGLVVEPSHNAFDHFQFGQQQSDRDLFVEGEVAFAAALGIKVQGFFEFMGNSQIIDNQATLLLKVNAVNPGDRLHQIVPLHRLVDIHGVKARSIKPGKPHIADDHQFEVIGGVFDPLRQNLAIFLVGVVFNEVAFIGGTGGHDNFDFAAVEVIAVPVGAKFDNLLVEIGSHQTAKGNDHTFATIGSLADFKVGDDILSDRP